MGGPDHSVTTGEPSATLRCRQGAGSPEGRPTESVEVIEQVAVEQVRAGDRDAYAVLVRLHAVAAHRTAVLFGAGPDAEDVVQTAFLKAYHAFSRFQDGAEFRPWLLRIVINETKNTARANGRRQAATARLAAVDLPLTDDDPATSALAGDRRRRLLAAVRALPDPQRRVVVCRFFLDLDEASTAVALDLPAGTVKSRLHRALKRLRKHLASDGTEAAHEI